MPFAFRKKADIDTLRKQWTGKLVSLKPGLREEWKRFEGKVGRVITVNYSNRAIVDFAMGPWTDIEDFETAFIEVTDPEEVKKYKPELNSAQPFPGRQG